MVTSFYVVFITAPKGTQAKKIARFLLKSRSAACVNIVPHVSSSYWWKGKIESASESLLIVKTQKARLKKLKDTIRKVHPYTVPEIIVLSIEDGHRPYLDWIKNETK